MWEMQRWPSYQTAQSKHVCNKYDDDDDADYDDADYDYDADCENADFDDADYGDADYNNDSDDGDDKWGKCNGNDDGNDDDDDVISDPVIKLLSQSKTRSSIEMKISQNCKN